MPCTPTPTLAFRMWWRSRVSAIAASTQDSHRYAARVSSMYPARRGQRKPGASCRHGGCHEETRHFQDAGRRAQGLAALARQRTEGLAVLPDARGAGAPRMGYRERHLLRDRATSRRYVRQPQVVSQERLVEAYERAKAGSWGVRHPSIPGQGGYGTGEEGSSEREQSDQCSAGRARLEKEAIEEFVGSLPMGNASEKSRQDASVTNLREQSEQIREELDTEEVDTVEVEPMLVSSLVSSSPSLRSGSSDSADASLSHESQNQNRNGLGAVTEPKEPNCYAMLPEQVKLVAGAVCTNQNLPGYFGLSFFTSDHDEPIARMASILYARNRSAFWLELLVQWAKKHKFWKTRLHNGERAVAQLVKFMETGDICEQFDAHLNVTSKGEALKARNDRHGNAYLLRNDE